jgi:DNA mismatch repair ATPase MutS
VKDIYAYAGFPDFWARSAPETPFGRDVHENPELFTDIDQLEKIYDQTEILLSLLRKIRNDGPRLSLITRHLKRLPRFPERGQQIYDEIELFQIKKFLHNYHALMGRLPDEVQRAFGFGYRSQPLEDKLNTGRQNPEAFYVADEYSPDLASVRSEILDTDARLRDLEEKRAKEIKDRYGLDFKGRPFLLTPKERLGDYVSASLLLVIEPYDDSLFSVRPLKCAASLTLAEKRRKLAQKERICEEAVLKSITQDVLTELPNLLQYRDAALAFDLAWARARMADELALSRPRLHTEKTMRISKGRFTPCESLCAAHGVPYSPLDANIEVGATVIFGSNMGGKTVVLQTISLLQLAAQCGLFVPAERFETCVFHSFHYIGERHGGDIHQGLSGFGLEMRQLILAWQSVGPDESGTLLLMDEFARTTSSNEAEAILAAVLEAVAQKRNTVALCSTHFHGLPRIPKVSFLRMAGMRHLDVSKRPGWDGLPQGADPIKEIALRMTYRLMPDDGKQGSDAIAVAQMLGLDSDLTDRAKSFFLGL